jgi:hypothetical protein
MILMASAEIGQRIIQSDSVSKAVSQTVDHVIDPSVDLLNTWIVLETKRIRSEMDASTTQTKE